MPRDARRMKHRTRRPGTFHGHPYVQQNRRFKKLTRRRVVRAGVRGKDAEHRAYRDVLAASRQTKDRCAAGDCGVASGFGVSSAGRRAAWTPRASPHGWVYGVPADEAPNSDARQVSRPPITVSSTRVSSSSAGGIARTSRDSTTKSANLPAVIVPVASPRSSRTRHRACSAGTPFDLMRLCGCQPPAGCRRASGASRRCRCRAADPSGTRGNRCRTPASRRPRRTARNGCARAGGAPARPAARNSRASWCRVWRRSPGWPRPRRDSRKRGRSAGAGTSTCSTRWRLWSPAVDARRMLVGVERHADRAVADRVQAHLQASAVVVRRHPRFELVLG